MRSIAAEKLPCPVADMPHPLVKNPELFVMAGRDDGKCLEGYAAEGFVMR